MTPERTSEGKWVIYHRATGQRMERWSIDARGLVASGDYTTDDPHGSGIAPSSSVSPPLASTDTPVTDLPQIVTRSIDAPPAQPVKIPTGHTSKGRKGR